MQVGRVTPQALPAHTPVVVARTKHSYGSGGVESAHPLELTLDLLEFGPFLIGYIGVARTRAFAALLPVFLLGKLFSVFARINRVFIESIFLLLLELLSQFNVLIIPLVLDHRIQHDLLVLC